MRICYIADGRTISIHPQRWLNYFAQKGHEVHLISPLPGEGFAKGVQLHLLVRLLPQIWPVTRYLNGLLWLAQARRLVKKIKPDILDAHYVTVNGYLAVASGFHPLVLSVWGSDILIDPQRNFLFKAATKYSLKRADVVTCDAEHIVEELVKHGAPQEKVRLIHFGTDTRKFKPGQKSEKLKGELGILDSTAVISLRSLKPIYDVESLIKAIPLVLEEIPEAKFIIAGEGEERQYLENLAASLGVSTSIRFVGMIANDELPQYLTSSDVYVSTSLSDAGLASSTAEAMACGLPVVITDFGDNRKWVEDGVNGFIVPLREPEALASRITYLLHNESDRIKFGQASRQIIEERNNYDKEMGKVEKFYEELIVRCKK